MHIALALISLLGALGYWYFVIRRANEAAGEFVDAAARARGAWRRRRFRNKAEASRVDAIDDPRAAASVIALAIARRDGQLADVQEDALKTAMRDVMQIADPDEFLIFAHWVLDGGFDANNVTLRLSRLLNARLTQDEKEELFRIVDAVTRCGEMPDAAQESALRLLRQRLGLAG